MNNYVLLEILSSALVIVLIVLFYTIRQSKKNEKQIKTQLEELNFLYLQRIQSEEALLIENKNLEISSNRLEEQQSLLLSNQERIEHYAYFDDLTKLPNRLSLKIDLEQLLNTHSMNLIQGAVFFIDFDNFKQINDHYGHSLGDDLLYIIAAHLNKCLEDYGKVYRFGSDEFVAVLDSVVDVDSVEFIAKKLVDDFKKPLSVQNNDFILKFSMGIALIPLHGNSFDELIGSADMAMYQIKSAGISGYTFFKEDKDAEKDDRATLKQELYNALAENALSFKYQPIFNSVSGKIALVETTIYLEGSTGYLPPQKMLQLAKELGMTTALNLAVFKTVCEMSNTLSSSENLILTTFNLSMNDLSNPHLIDEIKSVLNETKADSSTICLEITETAIESNYESVFNQLNILKTLGFRLVVDDFGAEFISLNHLKKMSVDFIKIDRLMFSESTAIVSPLLEIIKTLDIQIIVKNIESLEQTGVLSSGDINYVQGYYYSHPLEKENFIKLLLDEEIKIYPRLKKLAQTP
ncbi:MAG: EAL domain-containing protein [Clostridia bacterium]|nr:EAL domain-containing protein [Clostridia bacterium]